MTNIDHQIIQQCRLTHAQRRTLESIMAERPVAVDGTDAIEIIRSLFAVAAELKQDWDAYWRTDETETATPATPTPVAEQPKEVTA